MPCCDRPNSSPPSIMGVPHANRRQHAKFFASCLRSERMAGSTVSPSAPQFQELLSLDPSWLFSPFLSLCFELYETRSLSVNPSWQVTKFPLLWAGRPSSP